MRAGAFGIVVVGVLGTAAAHAQAPETVTPLAAAAHAAPILAPFEITRDHIDYEIDSDGTYEKRTEERVRILSEQGLHLLRQSGVAYMTGFQDADIEEAYTLKRDGTRIDVPSDGFFVTSGPATKGFADFREKMAVFPNVEVGDEIAIVKTFKQKEPWFKGEFYTDVVFGSLVPTHDVVITVTADPTELPLYVDMSGLKQGDTKSDGDEQTWTWTFNNDESVIPEPGSVAERDNAAHLTISSFKNFAGLAKAYEDGAHDKAEPDDEIKALADQITQGVTDRREQAHRLYDWVSTNIKYLAIVLGKGGLVPHYAADILHSRYGDCKDHVVLLEALLAAKGITSTAALINTDSSYTLGTVAAPDLFDHVITYVPEFDLYMDSTARYAPFGVLPDTDADKPVLQTATGILGRTPRLTAANEQVVSKSSIQIGEDGNAEGTTLVTASGASGIALRALMASLLPGMEANYIRETVPGASDGTLEKGDPAALTDPYVMAAHYTLTNATPLPGPGAVSFSIGHHPFSLPLAISASLPSRKSDYVCGSLHLVDETIINFPASEVITSIPKSNEISADEMKLTATYERVGDNGVKATRTLDVDHPHATCTADYYNRVRPQLVAMNAMLKAQVLYDVKPEKPAPVVKKKPAHKRKPHKPVLQAQAETKLKSSQN
jgi:transglutaminase-like putative cysteine protease